MMKITLPVLIVLLTFTACDFKKEITAVNIKLSPVYTDNMVIAKKERIELEGNASANSLLGVQIGNILKYGKSDTNGNWKIAFPPFDKSGPFDIKIIGKDSTITLYNVGIGNVELIAGRFDFTLSPEHITNKNINSKIRIYKIPQAYSRNRMDEIPESKWISTNLNFSDLSDLIEDSSRYESIPFVGLIVANKQRSGLPAWIDRDIYETSDYVYKDTTYVMYDTTNLKSLYTSMLKVLHEKDSLIQYSERAIERGILKRDFDDFLWWEITLPGYEGTKKIGRQRAIKWMRKKVFVSSKYITGNFYLSLGRLPEYHRVYFNETDITANTFNNTLFEIPDSIVKVWTNILTVRLISDKEETIIKGGENDFYIINSDSTYRFNLEGEWTLSERQEPELPEVIEAWKFPEIYYNTMIYPLKDLEIEAFYWIDKKPDKYQKNEKQLTRLLIESWSETFNWKCLNKKNE